MQVANAMTRDVHLVSPQHTLQQAASAMADIDVGLLPVAENERLVGIITDRDIAIRAVAQGKGPRALVGEVMSGEVKYCFEDEDTADVARNMADQQLRRLPVLNRDKRLVGILSLADIAVLDSPGNAGEALSGIAMPGGAHSQS